MQTRFFAVAITLCFLWSLVGCERSAEQRSAQGNGGPEQEGQSPSARPADVGFIEIRPVSIERTNELPGRVVAHEVAEIRPQVSGIIEQRLFREGSLVEQGQQLYQIDPARYEADLELARARLQDAKARRDNATLVFDRIEKLLAENAVSQQEYDDALSRLDQARAAVGLAEAEVRTAGINLEYTRVLAPLSGHIGPSAVTRGALVSAQQEAALATVRQLDPVYVDLFQTSAQASMLQEDFATAGTEGGDQNRFRVRLYLGNSGDHYPQEGRLDAIDPAVDPRTGAIRLRSIFPNPDRQLLPGMFVRASIATVGQSQEIVIPQKSVRIGANGEKTVWLVGADQKAVQRSIRTGAAFGGYWIVLDGLAPGDHLITEGRMNLGEGMPLAPQRIEFDPDPLTTAVPPDPSSRDVRASAAKDDHREKRKE